MCRSEPRSRLQAIEFNTPHMNARATLELVSGISKATVLRLALKECKSSARAEARARVNVGQSVGPQPCRARMPVLARKALVVLPRGLQLKSGMQRLVSSTPTPNPSIEGSHKRLRLLRSPHVKR